MKLYLITKGRDPWGSIEGGLSVFKRDLYHYGYITYDNCSIRSLYNHRQTWFKHKTVAYERI
jgi:hypothetical protein